MHYDELAPLLHRINTQQRQIRTQSKELEQKQNEFETVTRGMAEGIVLLNRKMNIIGINSAAAKLFHTSNFCIGKSILSVNRSLDLQLVSGIVLLLLDITERENAEQMRREFTANVSHELKTRGKAPWGGLIVVMGI